MAYSESAKRATMKYIKANYDRLEIKIPKGRKADLQAAVARVGESVNSYITKALFDRLGIASWDELDTKP